MSRIKILLFLSVLAAQVPLASATVTYVVPGLDKLIREDFVLVTDVGKLPESVKVSFCNIEKCNSVRVKFDMVNPGEARSTDAIIPGVPNSNHGPQH